MTATAVTHQPGPEAANGHNGRLDPDLQRALRQTATMRQGFYIVVLAVALAGQATGATHALHIPTLWAIPAVAALELGGIVILATADVRRRLGERATTTRLLSAAIAGWAVTFNWLTHPNQLQGGFYAIMSALGYAVWLTHAENQRRDRLRATGDLAPTTPAYELVGHWLRHPNRTLRARSLAKTNPGLGLYGSLTAAQNQIHRERQRRTIATVLHRKIRATVDPATADIALAIYDLDHIATRLAQTADYDTLTALINTDLTPNRLIAAPSHTADHEQHAEPATEPAGVPAIAPAQPGGPTAGPSTTSADTQPTEPATPPDGNQPIVWYQPTNAEDAAMYTAWKRGVEAGHEPTGAHLARAAGRPDDTTGIGRRAARRYREAHTAERHNSHRHTSTAATATPPA